MIYSAGGVDTQTAVTYGYTCSTCGEWVPNGTYHCCSWDPNCYQQWCYPPYYYDPRPSLPSKADLEYCPHCGKELK